MKKIVSIPCVALAVAALCPLFVAATSHINYTASFDCERLVIGTEELGENSYATVNYPGLYNPGSPGQPSLPVQYLKFSVPYNAVNFTVESTPTVGEVFSISHPVMPCQGTAGTVTAPDAALYGSGTPFPVATAWIVDEGMVAGENHVVTVAVTPVTCVQASENQYQLTLMERIDLSLGYESSDTSSVYPLVRDGRGLREKGFDLTRKVVVNPQDVTANAVSITPNQLRSYDENLIPDETITDSVTYLIITTPAMSHSMRRLAALKRQKGIDVRLVSLNDVLNDPIAWHGDSIPRGVYSYVSYTDDAGKLRQYIRDSYLHNGTEYVLLAGTGIPYRSHDSGQADMYFSDLITDWAYGACRYGAVQVGRLLGTKESQSENYTDKLFRYELNPGNGDYSYLKRGVVLESEQFDGCSSGLVPVMNPSFPELTLIAEQVDQLFPTGHDVLDSISTNHYGFLSSFNSGTPAYIQLYGPDENSRNYYLWALSGVKNMPNVTDTETGNGLDLMGNKAYPMICLSMSGKTMSYNSYETDNVEINLGESFTMGKSYGGPVFMGMTGNDASGLDMTLFADEFANSFGDVSTVLGDVYYHAKANYSETFWEELVCRHNYLGDPALDMWSDTPQKYSGVSLARSDAGVIISGISPSGTIVAYHSNDGTTGHQTVNTTSVTLSDVSPNSTIMLYKHNYIPYIAPLVLQNVTLGNSQYVIASEVTAGHAVDNNRTRGDVTVPIGVEYEIEASGTVKFEGGFKVEKGAYFAVRPSSYKD